jgi:Tetracyclin repressor-like, C-terminal domain
VVDGSGNGGVDVPPESRPPTELTALAAAPVLDLAKRLVGPGRALEAARLITAFANGFVSMELVGAFRLGGNLDEAYRYGVDVLVNAFAKRR